MNKFNTIATLALASSLAAPAAAATYEIDGAHSRVGFSVRHMLVSNTRGTFSKVAGTVLFDENNLGATEIRAEIDAASVNTHDAKRDEHLRSPDFFDVAKHPKISFRSKGIERSKKGYTIAGDLTIRGVTRRVTLEATVPTEEVRDPWGGVRRGLTATTTLNRKDFGVSWSKTLDGGGLVVGDEVRVDLDIELIRKDLEASAPSASR